jgi:hypothetical protein
LFVLKNFGEPNLRHLNIATLEAFFILIFGIVHFAVPFILSPNFIAQTTIWGSLRIADFVLPGCFAVAISAIVYFAIKNIIPGSVLAFLYAGGITFHALYLAGIFPSVLVIPNPSVPVGGIAIDAVSIVTIFDYYRRIHKHAIV